MNEVICTNCNWEGRAQAICPECGSDEVYHKDGNEDVN